MVANSGEDRGYVRGLYTMKPQKGIEICTQAHTAGVE